MLAVTGGTATIALAGCIGGDDAPAEDDDTPDYDFIDDEPDYEGYLDDANEYEGTVNWFGEGEVTVLNGGGPQGLSYEPAAIAIDLGTTVIWEWTGQGGAHTVTANDGEFDSGSAVDTEGETFEHTFDEPDVYLYHCEPHEGVGQKGAIYVVE